MKTFFMSDPHYDHANILTFLDKEGNKTRPFNSLEEMQETMVRNHNAVVGPEDKVYMLGDIVMKKNSIRFLERLNGRKTLIAGNHDIFNTKEYLKVFDNVRGYKMYPNYGIIMSHIPVHPAQLEYRFKFNVHGHLHTNHVMRTIANGKETHIKDKRYLNISVEQINYTPIEFEEVLTRLKLKPMQPKENYHG